MILAVGNINMDWVSTVSHLPKPDEKVNISELQVFPGGSASNFAVSLARLGSEVALFGYVGNDAEGREALRVLAEEKVDTSRTKLDSRLRTGLVFILVGEEGQTMKLRYKGANARLSPKDFTKKLFEDIELVYLASVPIPIVKRVVKLGRELGIKSAIDVGGELLDQPRRELQQMLGRFNFGFMNEGVFRQITGEPPNEKNIRDLMHSRMEILNVTAGAEGSFSASREEVFHMPVFDVEAIDTTGAGDAFAAGFIHFYFQGLSVMAILKRAAACAALQITQPGARAGLPTGQEVEKFCKDQGET